MSERALLIVNPAAGKRTAGDGDLGESVKLLEEAGFEIERRETGERGPTSADLAGSARRQGYRTVIVAGGDGTVAPAAIALLDSGVTLGILPFGSWMNIAHGLGLPLKPIDAARVIADRKIKPCDVGEVGDTFFFETCGIGLDADLFGAARLMEKQRFRLALRRLFHWATRSSRAVEITVDGKTTQHEVLQVLIVNSPYYGWAFPLIPNASMSDGLLEVAVFPRTGRFHLLRVLVEIWVRGRPRTPPWIRQGKEIEIRCRERLPVHADGQIAGQLPITVRCRPGALRVYA